MTLAGAGVASWDGGSGAIVSQATAARQPTMSTINGAPALSFDRTAGQRLISGVLGAPLMAQKDWTVFCAIKSTSVVLQQYVTMIGNRSADGFGVGIRCDATNSTRQVLATSVDFWQAGAATTNAEVWVVRCTSAGVRTMRVNGADDPMVSVALSAAPTAMATIGSQNDTATGTFGGLIAEVGVVASAVAGDDLAKLEAYLIGRYGV